MSEANRRRHVRDKTVIDHLTKRLFKRETPAPESQVSPRATTDTGLSVEGQVRKQWNPKKGGLPIFARR